LASFKRKLLFHKRNFKETIFEMLVPIIMILIGLSLTKINFKEETPPRDIVPEAYKW